MNPVKKIFVFLSKLFLAAAIDKTLKRQLPQIYQRLDIRIPVVMFNGAKPETVKSEIESIVERVINKKPTNEILYIVTSLYDPVQNARRIRHRPR